MNTKYPILTASLLALHSATAAEPYQNDRVYTANQVSNSVSVIDPSTRAHLGEIVLGKPQPGVPSPLYKGQSLVHGLRYEPSRKLLAVVSIGSNSVSLIKTETNELLKTIYIGRAPHEPTFTPDGREIWTTVRGESHVSVIDVAKMEEVRRIPVSDGPGMIAFSKDGKHAFVASSFTAVLDVVDTAGYKVIKQIPVVSPFSPNIYTSPDGKLVAMTHKDVGKVSLIDPEKLEVIKTLETGPLTNHVTFSESKGKLLMSITVGGQNCVKVYDVADDYKLIATIAVGTLPHGLWPSPDGKWMYVGLEYADQVQPVDMESLNALPAISIAQSPQALLYAANAVSGKEAGSGLTKLPAGGETLTISFKPVAPDSAAKAQIAVRTIGASDLIEHLFTQLKPNTGYTLFLAMKSTPGPEDQAIQAFVTDEKGKYAGHSTGLLNRASSEKEKFTRLLLIENNSKQVVLNADL